MVATIAGSSSVVTVDVLKVVFPEIGVAVGSFTTVVGQELIAIVRQLVVIAMEPTTLSPCIKAVDKIVRPIVIATT